jgi:DHA3 family macrolide efflux protein-like MFS transporter
MDHAWKRNTALFLISQTVSLFGSLLVEYAIVWHITLSTQSGAMMTISIICGFLPMFVLSPFAGVWADRYNRKVLIAAADAGIALATLVVAVLFMTGHNAIWMLFVASAIRSFGGAVQNPAVSAVFPQLVPADRLTKVQATYSSIQSVVALVSPMLAGALMSFARIEALFFIDVATAAIAVFVLLALLKIPSHEKAAGKQALSYFQDMRQGFDYIRRSPLVRTYCLYSAVFFLAVAPTAFLTPLQVARRFGGDVWRLTAMEIAWSSGMMAGGMLMAVWGGFRNRVHSMALSDFVVGLCTLGFALSPVFWVYLAFMALCGVAMPVFNTPATVMLQQKVDGNYLGRVFAVVNMLASITMPAGMLVFGPMADVVRIERLLLVGAAVMLGQSLFMLRNRVLLEAGRQQPRPRPEPQQ